MPGPQQVWAAQFNMWFFIIKTADRKPRPSDNSDFIGRKSIVTLFGCATRGITGVETFQYRICVRDLPCGFNAEFIYVIYKANYES